jgi:hypothetical protein
MTVTKWAVERRLADGTVARLGTVHRVAINGYRFVSNVAGHGNSRKGHPTFEACLPRWVGYPDRCETRVLEQKVTAAEVFSNPTGWLK